MPPPSMQNFHFHYTTTKFTLHWHGKGGLCGKATCQACQCHKRAVDECSERVTLLSPQEGEPTTWWTYSFTHIGSCFIMLIWHLSANWGNVECRWSDSTTLKMVTPFNRLYSGTFRSSNLLFLPFAQIFIWPKKWWWRSPVPNSSGGSLFDSITHSWTKPQTTSTGKYWHSAACRLCRCDDWVQFFVTPHSLTLPPPFHVSLVFRFYGKNSSYVHGGLDGNGKPAEAVYGQSVSESPAGPTVMGRSLYCSSSPEFQARHECFHFDL